MKYKHRKNLGRCLNDKKLKEQEIKLRYGLGGVPMMINQSKEWMILDKT